MARFLTAIVSVLIIMLAMESVWFAYVVEALYRPELGDLLAAEVRVLPAALFYLMYPLCVVVLAVRPLDIPIQPARAFGRGALLGLGAFGAYELTNLATLAGWSELVAVVDIVWGVFLTSFAAWVSAIFTQRLFANYHR